MTDADVVKQSIIPGFQPGVVGASPTIRSTFVASEDLLIRPITIHDARPFYETFHYLRSAPNGWHYGLFVGDELVGCATFKPLSGGNGAKGGRYQEFAKKNNFIIKELSRLALHDKLETNAESWFIARLIKAVRARGVDVLLAYADPLYGHMGTIYRATNWLYYGLSTGHFTSRGAFIVDGKSIPASSLRRLSSSAVERERKLREMYPTADIQVISKTPKHVYLYPVTRRARKPLEAFVRERHQRGSILAAENNIGGGSRYINGTH